MCVGEYILLLREYIVLRDKKQTDFTWILLDTASVRVCLSKRITCSLELVYEKWVIQHKGSQKITSANSLVAL